MGREAKRREERGELIPLLTLGRYDAGEADRRRAKRRDLEELYGRQAR
jgi:hypothetical protein